MFQAEAEPLRDFSFDTGLVPQNSPAQVSLKLSAGGKVKVDAAGNATTEGVNGRPGGGKLALDLHVKMAGRLKIDTSLKKVDSELPGLNDVDVPISGEVAFDPFLVGEGEKAEVAAAIPETKLPPIPLGSVPGKLELTVKSTSTVTSSFHGTCLATNSGEASYLGDSTIGGSLILEGTLVLDLPAPLNKAVDLGEIKVPIGAANQALDFGKQPAEGAPDTHAGAACKSNDGSKAGVSSSGSSSNGSSSNGSRDSGSAAGNVDPKPPGGQGDNKPSEPPPTASVTIDGTTTSIGQIVHWSEVAGPGKYNLFIPVSGPGIPTGTDISISATQVASTCSPGANMFTYRPLGRSYFPQNQAACGLTITQLPTQTGARLQGSFVGTVREANGSATHSLVVTFDTPR